VLAERFPVRGDEGRAGEEAEVHRIEIVAEAREGDFRRADGAARRVVPLEDADLPAAARQVDRGGKAVVAGADDDRVVVQAQSSHAKRGRGTAEGGGGGA
jgi:hypothetical protein